MSGDGVLRDGSETSSQFRQLLQNVSADDITRYVDECLGNKYKQGGLILQDLVNEIGRRLGFSIEDGFYRGGGKKIGFDGVWRDKYGYAFVIEVKTTDAYQINLDVQANYRQRLIDEKRIPIDQSSILLVVGRKDTGGLEAQTRGSRHAWDARIISIDALIKLHEVKQNLSGRETVTKIHEILKPLEYTRVDGLIDIIFSTAEDFTEEEVEPNEDIHSNHKPRVSPVAFQESVVDRVSQHLGKPLVKQGRCTISTANEGINLLSIASKEYERSGVFH